MEDRQFDVFMCHNGKDKSAVIEIAQRLRARGIQPWLDEWELRPGLDWQFVLEKHIEQISTAAIFVGKAGLGPWQEQETRAFLDEFVRRGCPVIPVLLNDAPIEPELPLFLRSKTWVDFRRQTPKPFEKLVWGITGVKPDTLDSPDTVELTSVIEPTLDARYTDLEHYLKNKQWKEADEETYRLMIAEVGKEEGQGFAPEDLLNFPCKLLKVINELWVTHSDSRFGFSIQKEMYLKCGSISDNQQYQEVWDKFCYMNGWQQIDRYVKVQYSGILPKGHMPSRLFINELSVSERILLNSSVLVESLRYDLIKRHGFIKGALIDDRRPRLSIFSSLASRLTKGFVA